MWSSLRLPEVSVLWLLIMPKGPRIFCFHSCFLAWVHGLELYMQGMVTETQFLDLSVQHAMGCPISCLVRKAYFKNEAKLMLLNSFSRVWFPTLQIRPICGPRVAGVNVIPSGCFLLSFEHVKCSAIWAHWRFVVWRLLLTPWGLLRGLRGGCWEHPSPPESSTTALYCFYNLQSLHLKGDCCPPAFLQSRDSEFQWSMEERNFLCGCLEGWVPPIRSVNITSCPFLALHPSTPSLVPLMPIRTSHLVACTHAFEI